MPRTSRWLTRRGRLDEKPSNDGTKTPRPHTLSASKTHTVTDCQTRLIRWWTRKGNKVKREENSAVSSCHPQAFFKVSLSLSYSNSIVSWMCCKKKISVPDSITTYWALSSIPYFFIKFEFNYRHSGIFKKEISFSLEYFSWKQKKLDTKKIVKFHSNFIQDLIMLVILKLCYIMTYIIFNESTKLT